MVFVWELWLGVAAPPANAVFPACVVPADDPSAGGCVSAVAGASGSELAGSVLVFAGADASGCAAAGVSAAGGFWTAGFRNTYRYVSPPATKASTTTLVIVMTRGRLLPFDRGASAMADGPGLAAGAILGGGPAAIGHAGPAANGGGATEGGLV
jgi:hypothetical protein